MEKKQFQCHPLHLRDLKALEPERSEICRICHMESSDCKPFYQPCRCMGSIGNVHQDCLKHWMFLSKQNSCEICSYKYKFRVPYSRIANFCASTLLYWRIFGEHCNNKICLAAQLIICLYLVPMLIADFALLLFLQRFSIFYKTDDFFYHLGLGYAICLPILFITVIQHKLSTILQKSPNLFWVYNCSASFKPAHQMENYFKWYESCDICRDMLLLPEKCFTGLVVYFISILHFFCTFLLAYVFMPYLLWRNMQALHADYLPNILRRYFFAALIIWLIYKLMLIFNCNKIRFHVYVCCLHVKLWLLLSWQYVLLPLWCGCVINCTAWLLCVQSKPCFNYAENPWQFPQHIFTGYIFSTYLQSELQQITDSTLLQPQSVLLLARTGVYRQLKKELTRFSVLSLGISFFICLPAYLLSNVDKRQQVSLELLHEFLWVRAFFKLCQRPAKIKYMPRRRKGPLQVLIHGTALALAACYNLFFIYELGFIFLHFCKFESVTYAFRYGAILFYLIEQIRHKPPLLKWQNLKIYMKMLLPLLSTLLTFLICAALQGIWFFYIVLLPFGICNKQNDDFLQCSVLATGTTGLPVLLFMLYVNNYSHNRLILRQIYAIWQRKFQDFSYKAMVIYFLSTLLHPSLVFCCLEMFVKNALIIVPDTNVHVAMTLFFIGCLLLHTEFKIIYGVFLELLSKRRRYEEQLQNYKRNYNFF